MAVSTSIHHLVPAESLKTRPRRTPRSSDFQGLAAAFALLKFCIAFNKSGTGVRGSAAGDERHWLRAHSGKVVKETQRRLVRAGVRLGSSGSTDVDPFDWDDSWRTIWSERRTNAYVAV